MKKLYHFILLFLTVSTVVMSLLVTWWTFYPYKVLEIQNIPFPVLTPKVKAGEYLVYHTQYCVTRDIAGTVRQNFQDHIIIFLPELNVHLTKGCVSKDTSVLIPPNLFPGKYALHNYGSYKVNPIREVTYTSQTEEFEVI